MVRTRGIDLRDSCPVAASIASPPAGGPPSILITSGYYLFTGWRGPLTGLLEIEAVFKEVMPMTDASRTAYLDHWRPHPSIAQHIASARNFRLPGAQPVGVL